MTRLVPVLIGLLLTLLPISGCETRSTDKVDVVCTTGMIAELVREIGGEHVHVRAIMGPGVDPHRYQSLPGDAADLKAADIIFHNGLHLEGSLSDTLTRLGQRKPVFAVADGIDPEQILRDDHGAADPHIWFDVRLWIQAAAYVRDRLIDHDPEHAETYRANEAIYRARLEALDAEVREELSLIPRSRRVLVTAHDAFGYFGRAYDVEVRAIQGISTETEASVADVDALKRFIRERQIKAVFVETSVSPRQVEALGVRIGGELFSDSMGPEGTSQGTYEGMVRHNVKTIMDALK